MTDEPNHPIDEPRETPEPVVTETGPADAAPASDEASSEGRPGAADAFPESCQGAPEKPVADAPDAPGEPEPSEAPSAAETPAEAHASGVPTAETPAEGPLADASAEGETPETAVPAEAAQAPAEEPSSQALGAAEEGEPSAEPDAPAAEEPSDEASSVKPVEAGAPAETEAAAEVDATGEAAEAGEASEAAEEGQEKEAEEEEEEKSENMDWYILKVQSNREDSIREGLLRRVAIAGLGRFFGDVIVPTEQVTEFKSGRKRVSKRKLYPGYLVVQMEINDDSWFLVRETPGIGDFTGPTGHPTPMLPHEVSRILAKKEEESEEAPKVKIPFLAGDRVKINEGTFENFEGEVHAIDEANGRVTVMINIFGRSTPVELEYWQIESV